MAVTPQVGTKTMRFSFLAPRAALILLMRLMLALAVLTAPAYALQTIQNDAAHIIEAPVQSSAGIGFVLLMGLQRQRG
jgi:hypothetical protein